MTREEQIDWLCRLRADLNNGVIFTPWNKEFTEALNSVLEQEPCEDCISRQAVIDMTGLSEWFDSSDSYNEFVIALSGLPPVTPQPCTDAISREDALMALTGEYTDSPIEILPKAIKRINVLPPVNPAEKVGKWKRISMDKYSEHAKYWYRCDRCGEDNLGNTNYCPNCGQRKMQEAEDEN